MPRVQRYPASPVQEIFLKEKLPFAQYDPTTEAKEAAAPATLDFDQCVTLKAKYEDTLKRSGKQTRQHEHSKWPPLSCLSAV